MSLYPYRMPRWIAQIFPRYIWSFPPHEREIYLTFDDGPIPEVTPRVLDILETAGVKATFFWVGENVARNTEVALDVISRGHSIGNHSNTHLKGWDVSTHRYLADVSQAQETIYEVTGERPRWFRPPYGRLTKAQGHRLKEHFEIVMWSALSWDFESRLSPTSVLKGTMGATRPGSIIVFHDSLKSEPRVLKALPEYLRWAKEEGFQFRTL